MMKKILLFGSFAFLCINLSGQTYLSLPDSNVMWVVDADDGGPGPDFYWVYMTDYTHNDTVINSTSYVKLYYGLMGNYIGGYRSDTSGRTFYIPADSSQEFLLMDLSVNAGDTVNVLYNAFQSPSATILKDAIVDSVNYITVGPYNLKRVYVRFPPIVSSENIWIEKIGTTGGFFSRTEGLGYTFLQCMSFNDTTYYSNSFPNPNQTPPVYYSGTCQVPNGIQNLSELASALIDPNPVTDFLFIKNVSNHNEFNEIKIFDSLFRLIYKSNNVSEDLSTIDVRLLQSGLYYLILSKDGIRTQIEKFIKL
jgi:Secretion system C-terminal sorting domain